MIQEKDVIAEKEQNALIATSAFLVNFFDYKVRVWDRRYDQFELYQKEGGVNYICFLNAEEVLQLKGKAQYHYRRITQQVQL